MSQTTCKCGRERYGTHPLCPRCFDAAITRLRALPAYKEWLSQHKAMLSSLIFNARTYMGKTYQRLE